MPQISLEKQPVYFRTKVAEGIVPDKDQAAIQRDGGKFKAGIIRGFSMISRGEALGHGLWIDGEMLQQVSDHTNKASAGIKARFTHPSLSSDGLGKMSARAFAARLDGDLVRADAHFLEAAHAAPDGDLAEYLMNLAEEDPASFGASISFKRDIAAEEEFMKKHGAQKRRDSEGYQYWDLSEFKSPDPKNVDNLPHVRLKSLRAVDFVDSPAANPEGLFHQGTFDLLEDASALLDYVFHLKPDAPDLDLGIDPSRLQGFVQRWAVSRKFHFVHDGFLHELPKPQEADMSATATAPAAPPADTGTANTNLSAGTPPANPPATPATPPANGTTEASSTPATPPPANSGAGNQASSGQTPPANLGAGAGIVSPPVKTTADLQAEIRSQLKEFTDRFGADNGLKWFNAGMSLEAAKDEHIKVLSEANAAYAKKVEAVGGGALGETEPLSSTPGSTASGQTEKDKEFNDLARRMGSQSLARAALAQKCPSPSKN